MLASAAVVLAAHLALARVAGDDVLGACSAAERQAAVRSADISLLGTVAQHPVVLASLQRDCVCGNVNCPYLVLRLDAGGGAAVLLSTYAYGVTPAGNASPLPNLRELAHDSALVSDETLDAYRGGTYVAVASARIRSDNGRRKPNAVPVHFAAGTSSAKLNGSVSLGWYDEYALGAAAGQHLTVSDIHGPATLTFSLTGPKNTPALDLKPGTPALLPSGGTYLLHVDGAGDGAQAYRATVTIR